MQSAVVPYNRAEAHNAYQRLQATLAANDVRTAIVEIKAFLKMFPDVAMAYNDLGVLYYKCDEKMLALACYEKANRLQPGMPAGIKNLAEFYFVELGWTDDAIMLLTELLKSYPQDFELLTALGSISRQIGQLDEAQMFYRRALELDPGNQSVKEVLAGLGGPVSAAEYQGATVAAPRTTVTDAGSTELDNILARLRQNVAAATAKPDPSVAQRDFGAEAQRLLNAGDLNGARRALEQAVAAEPRNAQLLNDLGVVCFRQGEMEQAAHYYEAAVAAQPMQLTYRKNLADLYYSCLGRTDEAVSIYTQLLNDYPRDVEVLTALAIISKNNHLREQAQVFIKKVLELEPWNSEAREFLVGL